MLDVACSSTDTPHRLVRVRSLDAPRPGFAGPGHMAVEVIGSSDLVATDPFVLLMDDRIDFAPGSAVGGPHPHAGLETVTFVLEGSLVDGEELGSGDLEWMTAGRGVIHSEDIRVPTGHARVLQLWVTLPETDRAVAPHVQIVRGADAPVHRAPGVEARVYSGATHGLQSPTRNHVPVTFLDVRLDQGATYEQSLPLSYNGFLLPIEGSARVQGPNERVSAGEIGWLAAQSGAMPLRITGDTPRTRVLLVAGARQDEPTVHHGPFVAGSRDALEKMYREFRAGRFKLLSQV
jgi:redox-sensitive bicupin YhaK (pirin superfamily)